MLAKIDVLADNRSEHPAFPLVRLRPLALELAAGLFEQLVRDFRRLVPASSLQGIHLAPYFDKPDIRLRVRLYLGEEALRELAREDGTFRRPFVLHTPLPEGIGARLGICRLKEGNLLPVGHLARRDRRKHVVGIRVAEQHLLDKRLPQLLIVPQLRKRGHHRIAHPRLVAAARQDVVVGLRGIGLFARFGEAEQARHVAGRDKHGVLLPYLCDIGRRPCGTGAILHQVRHFVRNYAIACHDLVDVGAYRRGNGLRPGGKELWSKRDVHLRQDASMAPVPAVEHDRLELPEEPHGVGAFRLVGADLRQPCKRLGRKKRAGGTGEVYSPRLREGIAARVEHRV